MHLTPEHITAYADGELAPAERKAAYQHLEACADCQRELRFLQSLSTGFAKTRVTPSSQFEASTLRRLQALPLPRRPFWKRTRWIPVAFLSASAATTLAFLWFAIQSPRPIQQLDAVTTINEDWQVAEEMDFLEDLELVEELDLLEAMDEGVPG